MKLLHTSDWHLGRLFHGVHLTEDQAHLLDQIVEIARQEKPDAVLVAGDVYDRAVPPPDAVRLLDDVLSRLVLGLQVPVIVIAGHHDSPQRMGFGARLLSGARLHVAGPVAAEVAPVVLADRDGAVHVYPLPYADPAEVRGALSDPALDTHQLAMQAQVQRIRARHPEGVRSVLVAHAFVAGGLESESERPLSIGGVDRVERETLESFSYVALGHLHRPQSASARARYSGSLMKYSFAEAAGTRSVNLVQLDGAGACHVEAIELRPRRDVRMVRGTLAELLQGPRTDDYLEVTLTDRGPVLDAMGRLREVYPNVLHHRRAELEAPAGGSAARDHRRISTQDLFAAFFQDATAAEMTGPEGEALREVLERLARAEREGGPP